MPLGSGYKKMKEFNKLLTDFKSAETIKTKTRLRKKHIMKNVDEPYEKHYNAYKDIYDNDYELNESKKKELDHKQFKLHDKINKELRLDEETKKFTEEIKEQEKGIDKNRFSRCFNFEPSALVSKLFSQDTQDLKKSLGRIKQQRIKLNADETNSTNNKDENDRLNMILGAIDKIYQFFEYKVFSDNQLDQRKEIDKSTIFEQPDQQIPNQQQQNKNLRLWVRSIDDYTKLKKMLSNIKSTNLHIMLMVGKQFKFNNINNFLICVNNQKAAKETFINFLIKHILKKM